MQTTPINIKQLVKAYLQCAIWADAPEGTNPRITKQATQQATATCTQFAELIKDIWPVILQYPAYWSHPDCNGYAEQALGHDLWLTTAGHGAGFHDRDALPDDLREQLDALCGWYKPIPEPYPHFYRGWMYL